MNENLYESINIIKFNYFCFDLIMSKKFINYLKLFKYARKFCFNYNNIFSVYQLTKLENFENIENIQITNNEICSSSGLIKNFLGYRMGRLKIFNKENIDEKEKSLSKIIFQIFDNAILQKEKEKEMEKEKNNLKENIYCNYNKDILFNDNSNKILMWNYVKENLSYALHLAIMEMDESD